MCILLPFPGLDHVEKELHSSLFSRSTSDAEKSLIRLTDNYSIKISNEKLNIIDISNLITLAI